MTQGTRERTSPPALDEGEPRELGSDARDLQADASALDPGAEPLPEGLPPVPALPAELHRQRLAQLESGLSLDERSPDAQPFVRCAQCETDAPLGSARCRTCNAALGTPEQAAYNQALWVRLRAEKEQERVRQQALREELEGARPPSVEELQRQMGEAIAGEVRARRTPRLGWRSGVALDAQGYRPLGLQALARLQDSGMRAWLLLGALGFAATMIWRALQRHGHGEGALAIGVLIALALFFLPAQRADEPSDELDS